VGLTEGVSDEGRKILKEMGLTEYETKIYLALLKIGATTANRISEHAVVPYSKIYEVLRSLEEKGWIETQSGRPRRYYPRSPTEAFEAAKIRIEGMMKGWSRGVLTELQPIYETMEVHEKPDIWILRGESGIFTKLKQILENTKTELMFAAPTLAAPFVVASSSMLKKLADSGVDIFMMFSSETKKILPSEISNIAEIRIRDSMFGGGVIADGREALLVLGEDKPSLIIWSDHMGLVKFAKDYFQHLWDTAYIT